MTSAAKYLHLISRLDGYGGARMLRHLARHQANCGAEVAVGALAAESHIVRELRAAGVDVRPLRSRGPWDVVAQARLVRMATHATGDVIHTWDVRSLALATLVNRRALPPCVATLSCADANRAWSGRVVKQARHRVVRFAVGDESTRAWLNELGVGAGLARTISPSVPPPKSTTRTRADLQTELSLPADAPLIAVVSPLVRSKRLDEAIWDFELVRVLHPAARLIVIGDGPDRARLERFAAQVSEPDAVRFLGFRDDCAELLPHVDLFWQLSASPAIPWALLEALAAGVAVVAADVPAHRSVIVSDEVGRLVPTGDRAEVTRATDELLGNPASAQRMGRAAAASVALNWPLGAALSAYEQMYRQSLASMNATVGSIDGEA